MKAKKTLIVLTVALLTGGLALSAQTQDQKRPEREKIRENIHRLRLLRLTEALDLSEEQAASVYPAARRIEKEKAEILKAIDGEMSVLKDLLEQPGPDANRLSAGVAKVKDLRQTIRDKDREFEALLDQKLNPVQKAKYVLFSAEFYKRVAAGLRGAREQTGIKREP